ncbi:MAG: hypothetical protein ACYCZN_02720 [Candidatus Dormibacteria bacterium]
MVAQPAEFSSYLIVDWKKWGYEITTATDGPGRARPDVAGPEGAVAPGAVV